MSEVHVWESSQIWRREDGAIVEDRQGKHYSSDPNEAFIHVVLLADYTALRAEVELLKVDLDETIKDSHKQLAEVERLKADIRDARGLMRGMIDAKDGRVARFLIERAERFIQRTADPTDASPASTTDA